MIIEKKQNDLLLKEKKESQVSNLPRKWLLKKPKKQEKTAENYEFGNLQESSFKHKK